MDNLKEEKQKKSIFDFSAKQSWKAAIGLFFIFFIVGMIIGYIIGALYGGINRDGYLKNVYFITFTVNYLYISLLWILVFLKKSLKSIIYIIIGAIISAISGIYGIIIGLIYFAFLTTRDNAKNKIEKPKLNFLIIENRIISIIMLILFLITAFVVGKMTMQKFYGNGVSVNDDNYNKNDKIEYGQELVAAMLYIKANDYYEKGDNEQALTTINLAIDNDNNSSEYHYLKRAILESTDKHREAIAEIEILKKLDSDNIVKLYASSAWNYIFLKEYKTALSETALGMLIVDKDLENDDFIELSLVQGHSFVLNGKIEEAQEVYKNVMSKFVENDWHYRIIGEMALFIVLDMRADDFEEIKEWFEKEHEKEKE